MSSNKGLKGSYGNKDTRESGKHGTEKAKGLFSPDDWSCKNCHNINWARRSTCNVCNTPRVSNLGERTGYGGGFMERDEVVEYRHRGGSDSEDEFDEFGRKKKRFRQSAQPTSGDKPSRDRSPNRANTKKSDKLAPSPVTSNHRASNEHNTEEESEESGDDADLSKYDIWSDDEADASGAPAQAETQSKRKNDAPDSASSDSDTGSSSSGSSDSSRAGKPGSGDSSSDSSSSDEPARNGQPLHRSRAHERDRSRFERAPWPASLVFALSHA